MTSGSSVATMFRTQLHFSTTIQADYDDGHYR